MINSNKQLRVLLSGCLITVAGEFLRMVGGNESRPSNLR